MGCLACDREREDRRERIGHNCGRLDRLGGELVDLRMPEHTSSGDVISRWRRCLVCQGTQLDPSGMCADPACWTKLRDGDRFRHQRPKPHATFSVPQTAEDAAEEDRAQAELDREEDLR